MADLLKLICEECGEAFYRTPYRRRRCCSVRCSNRHKSKARVLPRCAVTTKVCAGCGLLKLSTEFSPNPSRRPDGLARECRRCCRQRRRGRVRPPRDREKAAAQQRRAYKRWTPSHRERHNEKCRRSYHRCADRLSDGYVKRILENYQAPADLIEVKRAQLKVFRVLRSKGAL
jgi:hypothetical protein